MPFKRGKSHVVTSTSASVALYLAVQDFLPFLFGFSMEAIGDGTPSSNWWISLDGPDGPWIQIADRVSLALYATQWLKSAADSPFTIWTKQSVTDRDAHSWRFSLAERFLIHLDPLVLSQSKKRRRGAFVTRSPDGKFDVAEATPIRIRVPHK